MPSSGATGSGTSRARRPKSRVSSGSGRRGSGSNRTEQQLLLIYRCFKHKEGRVDFNAVGRLYGITGAAAKLRMSRLETLLAEMDEKDNASSAAPGAAPASDDAQATTASDDAQPEVDAGENDDTMDQEAN